MEREFLQLAATWLACRFRIINGDVLLRCPIPFDLAFDFMGCGDSAGEMRLLCKEVHERLYRIPSV